jgi:hypothetical protein
VAAFGAVGSCPRPTVAIPITAKDNRPVRIILSIKGLSCSIVA